MCPDGRSMHSIPEPWLDWQIRSMRASRDAIDNSKACIRFALLTKRKRFVGRIGIFGVGDGDSDVCKAALLWRPPSWWEPVITMVQRCGLGS